MNSTTLTRLCQAILILLPFSSAFTLSVGFTLKAYELLLPIAAFVALSEGRIDPGRGGRFLRLWLIFWFVALFPTALGLSRVLELDLTAYAWATGRYAPSTNALFHTVYLALDTFALAIFLSAWERGQLSAHGFARAWTIGAVLAVGYAVALNIAHAGGIPLHLLGRLDEVHFLRLGSFDVVRNGPLHEGNYFGLYLVLSYGLALWAAQRFTDRLFRAAPVAIAVGVVISASPAAFAGILLVIVFAAGERGLPLPLRRMQIAILTVIAVLFFTTPLLQELVIEKFALFLFGGSIDPGNVSLIQRLNEMNHGLQMAMRYPEGLGIGNFGYFWGEFPELFPWLRTEYILNKQIPNMIYLEILTEQGVLGFVVFLAAMVVLVRPTLNDRILGATALAMLGYFVVFPTFRLLFLWVFWAFLIHAAPRPSRDEGSAAPLPPSTPIGSSAG